MDCFTLPKLQPRPTDGHKGTFGTVGIIGGSVGSTDPLIARMIGAPALVAMSASRAGCGLVKIGAPEPILNAVLTLAPMATGYPIGEDGTAVLKRLASESDALVVGPGLGTTETIERLVTEAVNLDTLKAQCLVLDADAINTLCKFNPMPPRFTLPTILTPHPGEAKRLLDALGIDGDPSGTTKQRTDVCSTLAQRLGCILVLKGKGTVVSDGKRHWVCQHGHPCLGAGGTGDVLAGMIGSLAAQCIDDPGMDLFASTCIAVDAHANAGQSWAQDHAQAGLDPRDLGRYIPKIIGHYRT